ncbi:MAG: trigger factor [Epsilonproteobacteria bacterium]|nr:trigger factor [Campylobacterota bacterium]
MEVKAEKIDNANAKVEAIITKEEIEKRIDKITKKLAKEVNIPGFRKGKVPPVVIKKRYGDQIEKDAQNELIQEAINEGFKKLNINRNDMLGDPIFTKFEKNDNGIELELEIGFKPEVKTDGYEELIPEFQEPEVTPQEVQKRLEETLKAYAPFVEVEREAKEGDLVILDLEGELEDGTPIRKSENVELLLNGSFKDLEEKIVGMKKGESKEVEITFPERFNPAELAGKKAKLKITLKAVKEQEEVKMDDEFVKKAFPNRKDLTLEKLKEELKETIKKEKLSKLYEEELKPKLMETLVEKFEFDLPQNIVEQEIDVQLRMKASSMDKEELEKITSDPQKLKEFREQLRPDALKSVKATFIVDALAKVENIQVSDQELQSALSYEALLQGQDPVKYIKAYEEQGLIPAVRMALIEDKLLTHLLNKKLKKEAA